MKEIIVGNYIPVSVSNGYFTDGRTFFSEVYYLLSGCRYHQMYVYILYSSENQEAMKRALYPLFTPSFALN